MRTYETYIFDLDGTITDTMEVWLGIFRAGLEHFDIPLPDDKTILQYTHDWKELVHLGLPEEKVEDFAAFARDAANRQLSDASLHAGAYEMLEALKNKGKQIAIFSTMDRQIFEPAVLHRGLDKITDILIAGNDVPHRKPQPDGILKALQDLHVHGNDYKDAVYIGDKDTDIQAAHNAGIDSILYYPAAHQLMYNLDEVKQHKPTYVITDWNQLAID